MGGRGRLEVSTLPGVGRGVRGWADHSAKRRKPSLLEPKKSLSARGFAALGGDALNWRQTNVFWVLRD